MVLFCVFNTKTVEIRWNLRCKSFSLKFRLCKILDKSHVCFYVALTAPEQDNNGEAFSLTKNFKSVTIKQRKSFLNTLQSQWQLLSPPTWPSGNFHSTSPFSLRVNSTSCFKKTSIKCYYHCVQQSCKNVPTVPTSRCYFFWPVLIFVIKSTRKIANFWEKHAKNC